jgi:hypothetical protein
MSSATRCKFVIRRLLSLSQLKLSVTSGAQVATLRQLFAVHYTLVIALEESARSINNLDRAQNGVCDKIRDRIITDHRHSNPSWKNTRAELWNTSYWEYAKCFMPLEGYSEQNTFSETDLNGIISILLNQNDFVNEVNDSICEKVKQLCSLEFILSFHTFMVRKFCSSMSFSILINTRFCRNFKF